MASGLPEFLHRSPRHPAVLVEAKQRTDVGFGWSAGNARRASAVMIVFAHWSSSAEDCGRQTKIFLRLGVSPLPVILWGPPIVRDAIFGGVARCGPRRALRAPSSLRSSRAGGALSVAAPAGAGPKRRPVDGTATSGFANSRKKVATTVWSPALTGMRSS